MTRGIKVMLYVAGAMDQLRQLGYISGEAMRCTPKGVAEFDQLKASGFVPTKEELLQVLVEGAKDPKDAEGMALLILNALDD